MERELTVGVGTAALAGADLVLELGHAHPSAHGGLQVALVLEDDVVARAEPRVGFLHRGAEKLFEVRDYRQVLVLANRHDWLSAFSNEIGVVLAVERLLGLEVPARATWLRTLLAELDRVGNHLMFLAAVPLPDPLPLHRAREVLQRVLEEASGGRVHPMLNQVGGLKQDVPAGWTGRVRRAVEAVRPVVQAAAQRLADDEALAARAGGVGVLDRAACLAYGVTGPVARASGHDVDLRRDDPYLAYADLGFGTAFPVVLDDAGDSRARTLLLARTAAVALDLVDACLDRLPPGPVDVRLPNTVKAPEGEVYAWTENPLGTMGYYLVSRGEKTPYRLAMRTASFGNVSVLPHLLPGTRLQDVATVLGSLSFVVGDLDK